MILSGDITYVVNSYGQDNPYGCQDPFPIQFSYDAENRLVGRTGGTMTTSYVYDGQGTLVKKVENGVTTAYIDNLYEWNSSTGVTTYYWFNGRRVAMQGPTGLSFLLADNLGSTTLLLSGNGFPIGTNQRYYPFGKDQVCCVTSDKQFTGHQREGDLYFMKSRFYDPFIGRFLQPDSIVQDYANPQSLNRYSYVLNNPLGYTDPTGHYIVPTTGVNTQAICGMLGDNVPKQYRGT